MVKGYLPFFLGILVILLCKGILVILLGKGILIFLFICNFVPSINKRLKKNGDYLRTPMWLPMREREREMRIQEKKEREEKKMRERRKFFSLFFFFLSPSLSLVVEKTCFFIYARVQGLLRNVKKLIYPWNWWYYNLLILLLLMSFASMVLFQMHWNCSML